MKYFLLLLLIAISSILTFIPHFSQAAGVVPCATTENPAPCTLCHFIVGFWNVINYAFKILVFLSLAGITIAGIMYITSAGNEELTKTAKNFIRSILIGFALVIGSWLLIFIVMQYFAVKQDLGIGKANGWTKFECSMESSAGKGAAEIEENVPEREDTTVPMDKPLNNRNQCLDFCVRYYQTGTTAFNNCWKMKCPDVPLGTLTADDQCYIFCTRQNYTGDAYNNCFNKYCPYRK